MLVRIDKEEDLNPDHIVSVNGGIEGWIDVNVTGGRIHTFNMSRDEFREKINNAYVVNEALVMPAERINPIHGGAK